MYTKLSDLLNTTDGMTILRNNTAQDDGVDTISGVAWFKFNSVVASTIYVSGNSFVGFGSNSEHLKVCRRDCKMWYLYSQEGSIGITKFFKIRWEGYAQYNQTSASYALKWELFLFDDGGMFLNIISVPSTSGYLGVNTLTCGSNTYTFAVELSTPVKYSFIPTSDKSFELLADEYPVVVNRVPSGTCDFATDVVGVISTVKSSSISWVEDIPENTSLKVLSKLSHGEYIECTNGDPLPCINVGDNLSGETLYIRIEMSTDDLLLTPVLKNIQIRIFDILDPNVIVLTFDSGNTKSIQRAAGDITVSYDGSGTLMGQGGPVLAFEKKFSPEGLVPKDNPHDAEHVELTDIATTTALLRIRYRNSSETDHLSLADITTTCSLIHVDDI